MFLAGAFFLGALLNYAYLLLVGNTGLSNLTFLIFFAGLFTCSMAELVSHFGILGLKLRRIEWFYSEFKTRETTFVAPQTIYLPLCFCAVILWFQYLAK